MATIKDVAKLAGVGVGTASRAISGRGAIAPETLARVQAAAHALAFRPSMMARALSLKSVGMLGVYVPTFTGTFYGPILAAIDAELRTVERHMVAASGCGRGDARQQALDGVDFLIARECDGIIVLSNALESTDFVELQQRAGHLAVINRDVDSMIEQCFSVDHVQAGRLAARALLEQGHRAIALMEGPDQAPDNRARVEGFEAELALHGVEVQKAHRVAGDFSFASGHAGAGLLLAGAGRDYTALFCANDDMALAAMSRFTEAGLSVPRDISVMGFDDSPMAAYGTPPLTTVHVPMHAVAVNGCRHLINRCYGLDLPVLRMFPAQLVWRSSVAAGPHPPLR
jgi:LacI family transcriptional regulator